MNNYIIRGGYGLGNFGDDALMLWIITAIKKRDIGAKFYLNCKKSSYIKKYVDASFDLNSTENDLILIDGGGTIHYSFPIDDDNLFIKIWRKKKNLIRYIIGKYKDKSYKYRVKKKIMLGVGFGPFQSKSLNKLENAKKEITNSNFIMTRDESSYDFAKGINDNTILGCDLCYLDPPGDIFLNNSIKDNHHIAFILRDWSYGTNSDEYFNSAYIAAVNLRNNGFDVDFISFSVEADKLVNEKLISLGEKVIIWDPNNISFQSFINVLNQFRIIISSRFHGLIFATLLGIPSISIGIEDKLLLSKNNSPSIIWDPSLNNVDDILVMVKTIISHYNSYHLKTTKFSFEKNISIESIFDDIF